MNEKEFFDRLPSQLFEYDEFGSFEFTKSDDGGYLLYTENRYGEVELPWSDWVAFAEKIIAANKAAQEPRPGEILRSDTRLGAKTRPILLKLEDEDDDEIWLTAMRAKGHVPIMDKKGQVEWFAMEEGIHNGPGCSSCGWSCCMHCNGPEDIPQCIGTLEN